MSKRTRPTFPGMKRKVPRKTWRDLRLLLGAKKAKAFIKGMTP